MNVQDVIEQAMSAGYGRAVEQAQAPSGVYDVDIMKLAAALNFIGANLEDSTPSPSELLAQAELMKEAVRKAKAPRGMMKRIIEDNNAARGQGGGAPSPVASSAPHVSPIAAPAAPIVAPALRGAQPHAPISPIAPTVQMPAPVQPPPVPSNAQVKLQEMRARRAAAEAKLLEEQAARARHFGGADNTARGLGQNPPTQTAPTLGPKGQPGFPQPASAPQPTSAPRAPVAPGGLGEHLSRNKGRYMAGAAGLAALGAGAYLYSKRNRGEQTQKQASSQLEVPFYALPVAGVAGATGALAGGIGASRARAKLEAAGLDRDLAGGLGEGIAGGTGRTLYPAALAGLGVGAVAREAVRRYEKRNPGYQAPRGAAGKAGAAAAALAGLYGAYRGYKGPGERADAIIAAKGGHKKRASLGKQAMLGLASGALGTNVARRKLELEGLSPEHEGYVEGALGGLGRQAGYSLGGALGGSLIGAAVDRPDVGAVLGAAGGGMYGLYRGFKAPIERADDLIAAKGGRKKQAGFGKFAEDAINPAQISAGPAPAFSGEVMPAAGAPVFGGAMSPEQLVAMKAQKVRDRINSEMGAYVSQTGDGYNLDGHLSIFNK